MIYIYLCGSPHGKYSLCLTITWIWDNFSTFSFTSILHQHCWICYCVKLKAFIYFIQISIQSFSEVPIWFLDCQLTARTRFLSTCTYWWNFFLWIKQKQNSGDLQHFMSTLVSQLHLIEKDQASNHSCCAEKMTP